MAFDIDRTPVQLRSEDLADEIPMLVIELSRHVRDTRDDALRARDLHTRALISKDGREHSRVQAALVDLHEANARTCDQLERLVMTLRAHGRL